MGQGGDDDELDDVVPVPFGVAVPRREHYELSRFSLEDLKGAPVRVRANGFEYRGVLVGADEHEVYLRGEMRWVVLPLSDVTAVIPERPDDLGAPRRRGGS